MFKYRVFLKSGFQGIEMQMELTGHNRDHVCNKALSMLDKPVEWEVVAVCLLSNS